MLPDVSDGDFEVESDAPAQEQAREESPAPTGKRHAVADADFDSDDKDDPGDEDDAKAASEAAKTLASRKSAKDKRIENFQQKVDRLRWEQGEEERKLTEIRARRAAEEATLKPAPKADEPKKSFAALPDDNPDDPKPKSADFDDYEDFLDERASWVARRTISQEQAKAREAHQRTLATHADESRRAAFATRLAATRASHADFDARIAAGPLLSRPMQDAIVESELAGELMLHLSDPDNEADYEKIVSQPTALGQYAAIKKLEGKLETRLTAAPTGPAKAIPLSSAKPLIKPVSSSHGTTEVDDEDLDVDAHIEKHNRLDRQRRRA